MKADNMSCRAKSQNTAIFPLRRSFSGIGSSSAKLGQLSKQILLAPNSKGDGGKVKGTIRSFGMPKRLLAPSRCLHHSGPLASKDSGTHRIAVDATGSYESVVGKEMPWALSTVSGDGSDGSIDIGGLEASASACLSSDTARS